MAKAPTLSVVVPVLNEVDTLPAFLEQVHAALEPEKITYEVLFVNDGSTDGSQEFFERSAAGDPRVRAVTLSRNFGQQVAISAGLEYSRGRAVAIIDADLQDPPQLLSVFLAKWREGFDVVYGVRRKRKEGLPKRLAYKAFYRLLDRGANISIPLDSGDFCLMDRQVVAAVNRLPERVRFVRGLRAWVGFRQTGVEYERAARHAGKPKYTLRKLSHLAAEGLVGFSTSPLHLATKLGFVMALFALILVLAYFVQWLFSGSDWPPGFATLFLALCFLFGIQFILIGILGEYIGSIHIEVKRRPTYMVTKLVGLEREDEIDRSTRIDSCDRQPIDEPVARDRSEGRKAADATEPTPYQQGQAG